MKSIKNKLCEPMHTIQKICRPYANVNLANSLKALFSTLILLIGTNILTYKTFAIKPYGAISALFCVISALLLVRIFILFHDCTHFSFFKGRKTNKIVGTLLGILTLSPYHLWQYQHLTHHKNNGNLDKRGVGDIDVLTIEEYESLPKPKQNLYRLKRNPWILFLIGSFYYFFINMRFTPTTAHITTQKNQAIKRSVYFTTLAIILLQGTLTFFFGARYFLFCFFIPTYIAGIIGVFLFYIQHNFRDFSAMPEHEWKPFVASFEGSSHLLLPSWVEWLVGNINYHHIHHFNTQIPCYRLKTCFQADAIMTAKNSLSLSDAFKTLKLKLLDQKQKQMISWKEYHNRFLSD